MLGSPCRRCAPLTILLAVVSSFLPTAFPYAETGRWDLDLVVTGFVAKPFAKSMFNQTSVYLTVTVDSNASKNAPDATLTVEWTLRRTGCAEEYIQLLRSSEADQRKSAEIFLHNPVIPRYRQKTTLDGKTSNCRVGFIRGTPAIVQSNGRAHFQVATWSDVKEVNLCDESETEVPQGPPRTPAVVSAAATAGSGSAGSAGAAAKEAGDTPVDSRRRRRRRAAIASKPPHRHADPNATTDMIAQSWEDGVYALIVGFRPTMRTNVTFNVHMTVEIKSEKGYLSAGDYPKRPFYLVMCLLYVAYGIAWLIALAAKWRDLLQIQFWIGGVIILGTLEKAVFYTEYQTINNTGVSTPGAVLFAEIVSCAKRTLARMLVIIVSLGFGIVKPRLGPLLHRILLLGAVYFVLGSFEAGIRTYKHSGDQSQQLLLAQIPLAVIDAGICWWVFSSLVQTMRTLRLRRNTTKLGLFRHLTNVIIFSVIASVVFMIWSIRSHRIVECLTDWKELWVDDAFWHALFSILLAVIMVLWRPTANNQRYAFSALLDDADDADPEEEPMMTEAYEGMKLRSHVGDGAPTKDAAAAAAPVANKSPDDKFEEDLKWVEENIPTSVADAALPSLLDSDEEIMTTKFEMSKME